MADEGIPPSEPIEPGVEPTEPIEPTEPVEPTEPIEPIEPVQPPQPSSDEIVEKAFQKTASWLGRRDKELLDNVGNLIEQKMGQIGPEPISASPDAMLENPDQWIKTKFQQMRQEETQEQATYNNTMFKSAGHLMDTDPLFTDKELGTAVLEEVKKLSPQIDRRLPADAAGNMLVKDALANVYRNRASKKINPLDKNQPGNAPLGTITPPAPTPIKGKAPKLSPMAAEMAKKWGYKEDDIKRVFGEE